MKLEYKVNAFHAEHNLGNFKKNEIISRHIFNDEKKK